MKKLILSPFGITNNNLQENDIAELINASSYISSDLDTSKNIEQFIEQPTYDYISKKATTTKNILKNVNATLVNDFITTKNFTILEIPKIGSLVETISAPSKSNPYLNINRLQGVVVDILYGNRDLAFVCPISLSPSDATDKSLVLPNSNSLFDCEVVLRTEFIFPTFLDALTTRYGKSIDEEVIGKINRFRKNGSIDFSLFNTGVPNFDLLDFRISERKIFNRIVGAYSSESQEFLENEFLEDTEKDVFYNIVKDFDLTFLPYRVKEKEKENYSTVESKKIVSDFHQIKELTAA